MQVAGTVEEDLEVLERKLNALRKSLGDELRRRADGKRQNADIGQLYRISADRRQQTYSATGYLLGDPLTTTSRLILTANIHALSQLLINYGQQPTYVQSCQPSPFRRLCCIVAMINRLPSRRDVIWRMPSTTRASSI